MLPFLYGNLLYKIGNYTFWTDGILSEIEVSTYFINQKNMRLILAHLVSNMGKSGSTKLINPLYVHCTQIRVIVQCTMYIIPGRHAGCPGECSEGGGEDQLMKP